MNNYNRKLTEKELGYPRVCAHRGFSAIAPENSMPAFGAAVALDAEEIEFDLWPSADGEIVSVHDRSLERVSDGCGLVTDYTFEQLEKLDFGVKFGEKFKGLKIVEFEDILQRFSGRVIMNIHIKPLTYDDTPYPTHAMEKIVSLLKAYKAENYAYFMLETDIMIKQFKEYSPEIPICVGHLSDRPFEIVDRAIEFGCEKVQLFKPYFNKAMIDKAHKNGIKCNVFWSDDIEETKEFLQLGIDTVLTNNFIPISACVER